MAVTISIILGTILATYCTVGAYYSFIILASNQSKAYWLPLFGPIGWMTFVYIKTRSLPLTVTFWILGTALLLYWIAN